MPPAGQASVLALALLGVGPSQGVAASPAPSPADPALDWRVAEGRVSAQIEGWSLDRLLETVARVTRWQVYLDPAAEHVVRAKFRDLPPGEALRRLLGPLNFALLPEPGGPSRLYVFREARQAATLRIAVPPEAAETGEHRLRNEWIVTLPTGHPESLDALAARLGARVLGRSEALRAYRLQFDTPAEAEAARRVLEESGLSVDPNFLLERPQSAEVPLLGLSPSLGLRPQTGHDSARVTVAVVDTAVQGAAAGLEEFLLPAIAVAGEASLPSDQLLHGTSMAATVLYSLAAASGGRGATPVRILPVDVYGNHEATTSYEMALGIQAAIQAGATVVNLSLGGKDPNPFIHRLLAAGREREVLFLAAAGNAPVASPTYPAAYPEVLAVTALNRRGELAAYANRGDFVDVAAPGASLVTFQGQPYLVVGTSPATAHASALAAYLAATTGLRGAALEAAVRERLAAPPPPPAP